MVELAFSEGEIMSVGNKMTTMLEKSTHPRFLNFSLIVQLKNIDSH